MHEIRSKPATMRRRSLHVAAAVVLTAVAISACGGGSATTNAPVAEEVSTASTTTSATPATPALENEIDTAAAEATWNAITDRIGDTGEVDLQTALDAFSSIVAPLPGASADAALSGPEIGSASGPVRWLARHLDELTPEQRAIVGAALSPAGAGRGGSGGGTGGSDVGGATDVGAGGPGGGTGGSDVGGGTDVGAAGPGVGAYARGGGRVARARSIVEPPVDEPYTGCFGETPLFRDGEGTAPFREVLDGAIVELSHHLGHLDSIPIIGFTADEIVPNAKAVSMPFNTDCSKPAEICTILLTAKGQTLRGKALFSILVHELVHCYQGTVAPIDQMQAMEPWRMEGYANWAGEQIVGGSDRPEAEMHWRKYLDHPEASLFGRAYDAIGFFAHLDETGVDPWKLLKPLVKADGDEAAWSAALGGSSAEFLASWPTGFARDPVRGKEWDATGPGIPADFAIVPASSLANDGRLTLSVAPVADLIHDVHVTADIVTFAPSANAHGRVGFDDDTEMTFADVAGRRFCTLPNECECPEGTVLAAGVVLADFPGRAALVAVTGGLEGASVDLVGASLSSVCKPVLIDPCLIGSWHSDDFVIPSMLGKELEFRGGRGVALTIDESGRASFDFANMAPLVSTDKQTGTDIFEVSQGTASSQIETAMDQILVKEANFGGVTSRIWAEAYGDTVYDIPGPIGPAAFVMHGDGTYSCTDSTFTYSSFTEVGSFPMTVAVPFTRG